MKNTEGFEHLLEDYICALNDEYIGKPTYPYRDRLLNRDATLVKALNDIALSDNLYASLVAMTALQSIGEWG